MSTDHMMAAGNFGSPMQLIILLVIILLLFGGNRLRSLGGDLGAAIKGFKNSMTPDDEKEKEKAREKADSLKVIDGKLEADNVVSTKTESEKEHHKS